MVLANKDSRTQIFGPRKSIPYADTIFHVTLFLVE